MDVPRIPPRSITLIAIFFENAHDPEKAYFTKVRPWGNAQF
jgi:hypothetical protein